MYLDVKGDSYISRKISFQSLSLLLSNSQKVPGSNFRLCGYWSFHIWVHVSAWVCIWPYPLTPLFIQVYKIQSSWSSNGKSFPYQFWWHWYL